MSLRSRLVLGVVVLAIVFVGSAVVVTRTTKSYLINQVDEQLRSVSIRDPAGRQATLRGLNRLGLDRSLSSLYVAVVDRRGTLRIVRTPNLRSDDVALPVLTSADLTLAPGSTSQIRTTGASGSNMRYRILVRTGQEQTAKLIVGLPLSDVDATLARLLTLEVLATLVIIALLALVTFWVLHLGVRPIKLMTATASAIAAGDLAHRVPEQRPNTEAGELGGALNAMLGRIEDAFGQRDHTENRLRRFAADASHELRTPITTIRGYAELYRRGALDDPEQLSEAMRRTEAEAIRMGRLIEDLLMLARYDQGRPIELGWVDVAQIAGDALADAHAAQPDRPLHAAIEGPAAVLGEDGRLRQVLANVVSNALLHTDATVPVEVRVRVEGATVVTEVRDRGPGMAPEAVAQAFERFYRADSSRARERGGSGLGLSISHSIIAAHGGRISLTSLPGHGTTVRIELPAYLSPPATAD